MNASPVHLARVVDHPAQQFTRAFQVLAAEPGVRLDVYYWSTAERSLYCTITQTRMLLYGDTTWQPASGGLHRVLRSLALLTLITSNSRFSSPPLICSC